MVVDIGFFDDFKVLYWLSGLTCTDENFITKSGAQRVASAEGVALIAPDTSPSESFFVLAEFYTLIFDIFAFLEYCSQELVAAHLSLCFMLRR